MLVELHCRNCQRSFTASPEAPAAAVFDQATEAGPWSVLGDGETFEDAVAAALADHEADRCPCCGEVATVSEESLGRFTLALLATW